MSETEAGGTLVALVATLRVKPLTSRSASKPSRTHFVSPGTMLCEMNPHCEDSIGRRSSQFEGNLQIGARLVSATIQRLATLITLSDQVETMRSHHPIVSYTIDNVSM